MPILPWIILLLAALLALLCWLLYRSLLEHGRNLQQIEDLKTKLAARSSSADNAAPIERLFRSFKVNDQHDWDVVNNVAKRDEYGITDKRLDSGDVIVDVGANIGAFSLLCHILGSRAIFGYEPGERNFQLLKENVGYLPGVHLFHAAVWRSDGEGPWDLTLSEGPNSGSHSVLAAGHILHFEEQQLLDSAPDYPAACVPLDAILERFGRVKILKLDCEGSEFPILLTSRHLNRVDRIVAEVHECEEEVMAVLDPHSRLPGFPVYRLESLVAQLESFGFSVTTRTGQSHMHWFDARRDIRGADHAGQGISSTGNLS